MAIDFESLSPTKTNPIMLLLIGVGVAFVVGIAAFGVPYVVNVLNQGAVVLGLPSSVDQELALTGEEIISGTGPLGVGEHPYSTVTFQRTITALAGDSYGSISQYIWDEQPENWGNPLDIDNDYTTPKGTDGAKISVPTTSVITNSLMTATLATALGEGETKTDSQGNIIPVIKKYYVHGLITGAPDIFYILELPSAGKVDATTPTITLPTLNLAKLDTSTWQSTVLNLELPGGTGSGTEFDALISYKILDSNVTQIKQIKLDDLNKMGDGGALDRVVVSMTGMDDWTPYDYGTVDEFVYDGSTGFDAFLRGTDRSDVGILATIDGGESVNFEITVTADYGGPNQLGQDTVLTTVSVLDVEGNTLLSQDVNG